MSTKPTNLTSDTFDGAITSGVSLVDFWADWCPPCKALGPTIDAIAGEFDERALIAKVDVDENGGLAARFGVQSIPTMLFLRDGEVVDRVTGLATKGAIAARLESLFAA